MAGQTFQERSASFEHMYAPSRAKSLFSKHHSLKDLLDRDVSRMRWEWKTMDTELSKSIKHFTKRSEHLQQKVKDIEDRYFAALDDDTDGESEFSQSRPSTAASGLRSRSAIFRARRPQSSYVLQTPAVAAHEPRSKSQADVSRSRHNSSSETRQSDASAKLLQRKQQLSVRFEQPRNTESAPVRETVIALQNDVTDDGGAMTPASVDRRSAMRFRRSLSGSGLRLTKAKKYELRNQGFYDENERHKDVLKLRIEEYYEKVKKYRDCDTGSEIDRKSQIASVDTKPKEDVVEKDPAKEAEKFQLKLRNPFGMANYYHNQKESKETISSDFTMQDKPSTVTDEKSGVTVGTEVATATDTNATHDNNVVVPLTKQNVAKLNQVKSESTTSFGTERTAGAGDVTGTESRSGQQRQQRELLLRKRLSGLSGAEAERERARLLYQEAHAELDKHIVLQRNITSAPLVKRVPPKQSQLRLDKSRMRTKFEEFLDTSQNLDEMQKLVAEVAKMKAKTKKARDRSIVPFMSARKAAKTWKEIVAQHKAVNALLQSQEQLQVTSELKGGVNAAHQGITGK